MYYVGIGLLVLIINIAFVGLMTGVLYLYWKIGTKKTEA